MTIDRPTTQEVIIITSSNRMNNYNQTYVRDRDALISPMGMLHSWLRVMRIMSDFAKCDEGKRTITDIMVLQHVYSTCTATIHNTFALRKNTFNTFKFECTCTE